MNSTISLNRISAAHRTHTRIRSDPRPAEVESRYFDTHLNCTIVATTPESDPSSWFAFMTGARASYRKYGVESALEFDAVIDGKSTALFFLAYDADHTPIGGFRIQGPYATPAETHADLEWTGHPGRTALRAMISDRLPYGVVELKTVWMTPGARPDCEPGYLGAVGATLGAVALNSRFTLATSAEHTAGPYVRSGGVIAQHIDPVPYPDDRYRTRALWWDQRSLARDAAPDQHVRVLAARDAMFPSADTDDQKAIAS